MANGIWDQKPEKTLKIRVLLQYYNAYCVGSYTQFFDLSVSQTFSSHVLPDEIPLFVIRWFCYHYYLKQKATSCSRIIDVCQMNIRMSKKADTSKKVIAQKILSGNLPVLEFSLQLPRKMSSMSVCQNSAQKSQSLNTFVTDGGRDRRRDRLTDEHTDGRSDGRTDEQTDGRSNLFTIKKRGRI